MKHFTTKRAALERSYRKVLATIREDREPCCAGCGTYRGRITPSHRIPRSYRIELLDDPENIDWMCPDCHENVEVGNYAALDNGQEILDYIERVDPQYFYIKTL